MACNLKNLRLKKGMSQAELSQKSNVSRAIISGLESGRIAVTTTGTLSKLAEALGVPVSKFF